MKIEIFELESGARQAKGLTVVIDVFRSFSVDAYIANNGAERIIPKDTVESAYKLKLKYPHSLLIGERNGKPLNGFDFGNSPTEIIAKSFAGKTVIQTTGAGTRGICSASQADEILAGSFPMAAALEKYIRNKKPDYVSLVAMGTRGEIHCDEDCCFAEYLRNQLLGIQGKSIEMIRSELKHSASAKKFFDSNATWAPEEDFELCLSLRRFPFVLRLEKETFFSEKALKRVDVSLR